MQRAFSGPDVGALPGDKIVSRAEWGAEPPSGEVPLIPHKPNYISFTFNTKTTGCETKEDCKRIVREIQQREMTEEGLPDISFNFLVGNDGYVYEGRGWKHKAVFAHKKNPPAEHPDQTIDIAFIGDYTADRCPFEMIERAIMLANYGVSKKQVMPSYTFCN